MGLVAFSISKLGLCLRAWWVEPWLFPIWPPAFQVNVTVGVPTDLPSSIVILVPRSFRLISSLWIALIVEEISEISFSILEAVYEDLSRGRVMKLPVSANEGFT